MCSASSRVLALACLAAGVLAWGSARAQSAPASAASPSPPPPSPAQSEPGASDQGEPPLPAGLGAAGAGAELPPVNDPDLAPPPPAPRKIASWGEALRWVRARSPAYLTSYEATRRAEAAYRAALAGVLPTLAAHGSYTHQFFTDRIALGATSIVVPPPNVWAAGVSLDWPLLDLGAYKAAGTAHRGEEVGRQAFAEQRRELAGTLIDTMLGTLATERVAELDRVGLRAALERLELTQLKLRYQAGTPFDVDRAEQDVASARSALVQSDENLRQARETLGLALGSKVPLSAPSDLDLSGFVEAVAASCHPVDDIERRADVARARAALSVARRRRAEVWYSFAPSLSVRSDLAYSSNVTFGPKTTWDVQGVVTLPLFEGGARLASLEDADAALRQAQQALVEARLAALVDAARSARAVSVLTRTRDLAKRQRDLAERVDRRTREAYLHGLGTSLDLVVSGQALRQAQTNLALLEFQLAGARAHAVLAEARCIY